MENESEGPQAPADPAGASLPRIFLKPGHDRRFVAGHPWVYSNELRMDEPARAIAAGSLVSLHRVDGKALGIGTFNPRTLITFRLLSRTPRTRIDADFVVARLEHALALRRCFFALPFYRLVHAEADGLPGLVVDRFDDVLVVQANTAGMDRLTPIVLEALDRLTAPRAVVLRNDSPARENEGLATEVRVVRGALDGPVVVREGGLEMLADVVAGQKTGWFFDQSANRAAVAPLARDGRMLDLFCYSGGFAVAAAAAGARAVVGVDSSEAALALARHSASAAKVANRCEFRRADVFAELERLAAAGERFRLVVADPPAFAKSRKDVPVALRGYRKLARLAATLVEPDGFLFVASCSHNVDAEAFGAEVAHGITRLGRDGRVVIRAGAGPDHPVHLHLPESAYLKSMLVQIG